MHKLSGDDPEQKAIDQYRTLEAANDALAPSSTRWILDTENVELLRSDFTSDGAYALKSTIGG